MMGENPAPTIVLLAAPETSPSVLYGMYEVLYSVGAVFLDMTIGKPGTEMLNVQIVSEDGKPFRCFGNVMVEPHAAAHDITQVDVVVVCDMYTPINEAPIGKYPESALWLRSMYEKGALISSICSGSLVLAEAGLLDGRETAAHWAYGELFSKSYPKTTMKKDSVLCLSEASDRIVTAGGVTSWQNLAVYLIAQFCGQKLACETAKIFLLAGHEDGQLPFAAMNRSIDASDAIIAKSQHWIAEHYSTPHPVDKMVKLTGLNHRTFSRRFKAATGHSPIEYVQSLRVEEAKQMLEMSAILPDDIGHAVGYEDTSSFRRVFKRKVGISAAAYRKKFEHILHP